jgi:hypothetical protein
VRERKWNLHSLVTMDTDPLSREVSNKPIIIFNRSNTIYAASVASIAGYIVKTLNEIFHCVAGQIATIRFGRGRRPRGPTYDRGTIRSLFENQELAR